MAGIISHNMLVVLILQFLYSKKNPQNIGGARALWVIMYFIYDAATEYGKNLFLNPH